MSEREYGLPNTLAGQRWEPARKDVTPGAVRLSEEAAAKYLGISHIALNKRRRYGTGPRCYMHMGRIAYDVAALDEYKAAAE